MSDRGEMCRRRCSSRLETSDSSFVSLPLMFVKNTVKTKATAAHGINEMNAHLTPFLNPFLTNSWTSGGKMSISWMEPNPPLPEIDARAAACSAETAPDATAS